MNCKLKVIMKVNRRNVHYQYVSINWTAKGASLHIGTFPRLTDTV